MALPGISSSTRATGSTVDRSSTPDADWPVQATDAIVRVVDNVRDKTTGPALNAARWATYGLVLAALAVPLFVLLLVGAMRGVEGLLLLIGEKFDIAWLHDPMWIVYLLFGSSFVLGGLVAWRKADIPAPA